MYLWSIEPLAQKLKANELSEWEKAKIYLLAVALTMASNLISLAFGVALNWLVALTVFLSTGVIVACVIYAFNLNQKGDDKNFLERLVCLSLPSFVRASVLNYAIMFGYYLAGPYLTLPFALAVALYIVLGSMLYILMFYFIIRGFRAIHA